MFHNILSSYNIDLSANIEPFGTGLINRTWKVSCRDGNYILQKINDRVFREPVLIAENIQALAAALRNTYSDYFFVAPLPAADGKTIVHVAGDGYFRIFPFVKDSYTSNTTGTPQQTFEAARQFGLFTRMLNDFPAKNLHITLPGFHDLELRYAQFEEALAKGNPSRIERSGAIIDLLQSHKHIVSTYKSIRSGTAFKTRVTHHDTKISNVLFDRQQKGICVIDLDTVMPGFFISDVGDMMRTYLSPVSEEEQDTGRIIIREDHFKAIAAGYLGQMGAYLSDEEIDHFVYAGFFMTYMQALRFLTDHFNNDSYYGASYEGHNYIRALNQSTLLQRLIEKEEWMKGVVNAIRIQVCR